MRTLLLAAMFVCIFASQALGDDKFTQMDADSNNLISWEEFQAANPSMKRAAFEMIDTDKDGALSLEEWQTFRSSHGNRQGMPMPHKPMPQPEESPAMPLIRPPKDAN